MPWCSPVITYNLLQSATIKFVPLVGMRAYMCAYIQMSGWYQEGLIQDDCMLSSGEDWLPPGEALGFVSSNEPDAPIAAYHEQRSVPDEAGKDANVTWYYLDETGECMGPYAATTMQALYRDDDQAPGPNTLVSNGDDWVIARYGRLLFKYAHAAHGGGALVPCVLLIGLEVCSCFRVYCTLVYLARYHLCGGPADFEIYAKANGY